MATKIIGGETLQGLYGDAAWGSDQGVVLDEMLRPGPTGSAWIPVGRSTSDPSLGTVWDPRHHQGHAITIAPTRSGKGVSAIIPALMTYAGSCLVVDPKGENAWVTAERRRSFGHRVVILDPWNEVNRRYAKGEAVETVTTFNPLASLEPTDVDFADDVAALAAAMVISAGHDPHWGDSARELLSGCIAAVVERRPRTATLAEVRDLLTMGAEKFAAAVTFFQKLNPGSLGSRKLDGFKEASKENDSIRSTARTQTAFLDSAPIKAAMESNSEPFDLAELGRDRVTVYLVLPSARLETHGRWLRLIMSLALQACDRQAMPAWLPVLFVLDEFGTIGRMPMIERAFGLAAGSGAGVRLWCFLQNLGQLSGDYPQTWQTFIANSDVLQVLAVRDDQTAEHISKLAGKQSWHMTAIHGAVGAYVTPSKDVERPLIYPDSIARLPRHLQLVLYAGGNAICTGRLRYFDVSEWEGLYRPIPWLAAKTHLVPVAGPSLLRRLVMVLVGAIQKWDAFQERRAERLEDIRQRAAELAPVEDRLRLAKARLRLANRDIYKARLNYVRWKLNNVIAGKRQA